MTIDALVPYRDRRFWIIQVLVLAIDFAHTFLEDRQLLVGDSELYLLSISVVLIPVVYASLGFGLRGAVPTTVWALTLSLPEIHHHDATVRVGILTQFAIVLAIATIVGVRVDRERAASRSIQVAKRDLELYIAMATEAQEEERKRLSRELHDDIMQSLVVAKGQMESAATAAEADHMQRRLAGARLVIEDAIINLRRYCRALRPSLLDDLGLADAVDWLVGDLRARTGLAVTLQRVGAAYRLSSREELLIFRVVQEALHNVESHARATEAHVMLAFENGVVRASVSDNGCGIDRTGRKGNAEQSGLGIRGMEERAKLLRGTLTITSPASGGTELRLVVPLDRSVRSACV